MEHVANEEDQVDRRGMIGKLVAGAAGAAAAAVLLDPGEAQAAPSFELNVNQPSTLNTNLNGPGGTLPWNGPRIGLPVVLSVQCTLSGNNALAVRGSDVDDAYAIYGAGAFGVVGIAAAANALPNDPSRGVWGLGNVPGTTGVVAEFLGGANVSGAPLRIADSTATAAAPTGGTHLTGEMSVRQGNLWMCVAGGTPGTWVRIAGPATRGDDIRLLDPPPTADGTAPTSGTFAAGEAFVSAGLVWLCTAGGTPGTWLNLNPTAPARGNDIRLLVPAPTADGTAPTSGTFAAGEMFESAGRVWLCTVGGTPGTWRNLNPAPPAGNVVTIVPGRVLDTRSGPKVAAGEERTVNVATSLENVPLVPSNATGVLFNLTVADTAGLGFMAVFPAGTAYAGTSSINWTTTGAVIANSGVSALGPNTSIILRGGAGTTHAIIDVTGYIV